MPRQCHRPASRGNHRARRDAGGSVIEQFFIAAFGVLSIWTSQDSDGRVRRYACLFGICAQPFWLYATWQAAQWGMFALTLAYTAGWSRGIWNHWLRPRAAT